jgi:hypothetical protein
MIAVSVNCSRVSVRRVGRVLQELQGCASHSEAATGTIISCSHGPVGRVRRVLPRPATGRWLQEKERT